MSSFTAGPWNMLWVEGKSCGSHFEYIGREVPDGWGLFLHSGKVAETESEVSFSGPQSFTREDIQLISAAPDLLEACNRTLEILDAWGPERRGDTLERLHERLTAAITKATGGSNE